jgi:gliding motility-associated-like protein
VAIIGTDSVIMEGNIDVSGLGFKGGAVPDEFYNDICRYNKTTNIHDRDTLYFRSYEINRSGNKGEGIVPANWPYTKGSAFNLNGGGAGNGRYSGGGGGSNYSAGGAGGKQSNVCTDLLSVYGGWGGYACQDLYKNSTPEYGSPKYPRVILGGGGGSGTKLLGATTFSKGGDGGGLVILITEKLVKNGGSILATGENAANTTGSGGGGGGGGSVIIDATSYSGTSTMTINIRGGKGGNAVHVTDCNGAGGGGSGGILLYAGTSIPALVDSSKGDRGTTKDPFLCSARNGFDGAQGGALKGLITPLTGFLFNTIRGTDTVCAGKAPDLLTGSQPKGGDGSYTYQWEHSSDNFNWSSAPGTNNEKTYQPSSLNQTTFYRRIVSSSSIFDTSKSIKVFVYNAISGNTITGSDIICSGADAGPITGTTPNGGNGIYRYQWFSGNDLNSLTGGELLTSNEPLDPGQLTDTTYVRRVVTSTEYCYDTSSYVTITVLPNIGNNAFISPDTVLCENLSPGPLNALVPTGGDGTYSYSWQNKSVSGVWATIPLSNIQRYNPGVLTDTTLYRRIAYSGSGNACIDTSSAKTIKAMPQIANNTITCSPVQYTCNGSPITLPGSQPVSGDGTYQYQWEQSGNNIDWAQIAATSISCTTSPLTSKQYFRRIVYSSPVNHACTNVSDAVEVRINSLPTGDVFNSGDTICEGETLYIKFNVGGDNGPFKVTVGDGMNNLSKEGISSSPDSIEFLPTITRPFHMIEVEDDSGCYANVNDFENADNVVVYDIPIAFAGNDDEVCGNVYSLQAVKSYSTSTGLWTLTGMEFSDPTEENSSVTVTNYGTHVLTWLETNWHCSNSDEVEITFYEQPLTPDAGIDQTLDFKYTTQLQAVTPAVGQGKWYVLTGNALFDNDTLPDATVSELANTTSLKWTVINGVCPSVSDSMKIIVSPLLVPRGFTPNNDDKHDYFEIGAVNAELIKIKIYNSTGVLVFESDDYTPENLWNGYNMDNVEVPEGTYFYIMSIKVTGKTDELQFRSFVEILR